eukprot:scaffold650431_cov38-Prasinocladus_malaysianus.AAC.1
MTPQRVKNCGVHHWFWGVVGRAGPVISRDGLNGGRPAGDDLERRPRLPGQVVFQVEVEDVLKGVHRHPHV